MRAARDQEAVLVTGACGQIGRAVSHILRNSGRQVLRVDVERGTPSVAALQRTFTPWGVDDKTIRAILRHSNIGTAYIKSGTKSQVSAMDSLSDNLGTCNAGKVTGELKLRNINKSQEMLEPRARVELATCRLRIGCSTTELPRPCTVFMRLFADSGFALGHIWATFDYPFKLPHGFTARISGF
jgi:hypothetical protein